MGDLVRGRVKPEEGYIATQMVAYQSVLERGTQTKYFHLDVMEFLSSRHRYVLMYQHVSGVGIRNRRLIWPICSYIQRSILIFTSLVLRSRYLGLS